MLCNIPKDYKDCIIKAFNKWHTYYRDNIYILLKQFPLDSKTKEGLPFWSGTKRAPIIIDFDVKNDVHVKYVYCMANLYGYIYGLQVYDEQYVTKTLLNLNPPSLPIIKETTEDHSDQHENAISILINKLPAKDNLYVVNCIEFEKDNDENFHIDFVVAASNMRNVNYGIELASRYETKGIAGKIIPAIATTTSVVAGLSILELYKLVWGCSDIEKYKNNFLNLALPFIGNADPMKCPVTKVCGKDYTMWDKYIIDSIKLFNKNDITLQELINYMNSTYNFTIDMLSMGTYAIYNTFGDKNKIKARLEKNIMDIYAEVFGKPNNKYIYINVYIEQDDDNEEELMVPTIKYKVI